MELRISRMPTSRSWGVRNSRARMSKDWHGDRSADSLPNAFATRGQPFHEDQEADDRRAAARDVSLHIRLRSGTGITYRQASRDRLRRVRDSRPDHDGLGHQRLLEQLLLDPPAEVPGCDPGPALVTGLTARAVACLFARWLHAGPAGLGAHVHCRFVPGRPAC